MGINIEPFQEQLVNYQKNIDECKKLQRELAEFIFANIRMLQQVSTNTLVNICSAGGEPSTSTELPKAIPSNASLYPTTLIETIHVACASAQALSRSLNHQLEPLIEICEKNLATSATLVADILKFNELPQPSSQRSALGYALKESAYEENLRRAFNTLQSNTADMERLRRECSSPLATMRTNVSGLPSQLGMFATAPTTATSATAAAAPSSPSAPS